MHATDARDDRSIGELFKDLSRQVSTLVRLELGLASTEMREKFSGVAREVAMVAAGGLLAYAGLFGVLAALVILLAELMPWWAAALVVGILVIAGGAFLIRRGLDGLKQADLAPRQTVRSLQADIATVKREAA